MNATDIIGGLGRSPLVVAMLYMQKWITSWANKHTQIACDRLLKSVLVALPTQFEIVGRRNVASVRVSQTHIWTVCSNEKRTTRFLLIYLHYSSFAAIAANSLNRLLSLCGTIGRCVSGCVITHTRDSNYCMNRNVNAVFGTRKMPG